MQIKQFIIIGENIHCTRVFKREGNLVGSAPDGRPAVIYDDSGKKKFLPIPEIILKGGDRENNKVKHCVAAIWQGMNGKEADRDAGLDYLRVMASKQEKAGATYLDINVDEYSLDLEERIRAMQWTAEVVQKASPLPLSIDSSNADIIRAGLQACDPQRVRPVVNSISLERLSLLKPVAEYKASVVASAAGEHGLPGTVEERIANFDRLIPKLLAVGIGYPAMHLDPLVYTISTDPINGKMFLETIAAARKKYDPAIHIIGGLSNVSFGMPSRKLINQVFAWLSVEAGGDGGIVDPLQINADILGKLDTAGEPFQLAKALLTGVDEFGMNFITAHREKRIA
ncbi:MAG: dihydropteroate synthase [Kiritimatiellia bacterium]|nr:dihydropteroate synthase [Kiritimatiellia bacterium]